MFDDTDDAQFSPICGGSAYIRITAGHTEIWPEEYYSANRPLGRIEHPPRGAIESVGERAEAWFRAWAAGHGAGFADGHRAGFAACQAGLRALLGAGSAADVARLLEAAKRARED